MGGVLATMNMIRSKKVANSECKTSKVGKLYRNAIYQQKLCREQTKCDRCEGHCDSDKDCGDNLKCSNRQSHTSGVEGCEGTPTRGNNYCFMPKDEPSETENSDWSVAFWVRLPRNTDIVTAAEGTKATPSTQNIFKKANIVIAPTVTFWCY